MHCDNKVIAEAQTEKECRELADETKIWNMLPGTHAPYVITSLHPQFECSLCGGSGEIRDYEDRYVCSACEGTGWSIDFEGRKKTTAAVCKNCSLYGDDVCMQFQHTCGKKLVAINLRNTRI